MNSIGNFPEKLDNYKVAVFDIEANGLSIHDVTEIFCISIKDLDTGENTLYEPLDIKEACKKLSTYDYVVGHNILAYDIPVIRKISGIDLNDKAIDTLLLAKYSTLRFKNGYSLKAIGEAMKFPKIEYDNFSYYEPEMGEYCKQDVEVTAKFFTKYLLPSINLSEQGIKLEHKVRQLQTEGEHYAVWFDIQLAQRVVAILEKLMNKISNKIEPLLGYGLVVHYKGSKKNNEPFIYNLTSKGNPTSYAKKWVGDNQEVVGPFCKIEYQKVTLSTEALLKDKLLELGWEPTMFTPTGKPKIVDKGEVCPNLLKLGEFKDVSKYFVYRHRHSLVSGLILVAEDHRDMGWRIPSEADTMGAITHRYTHRKIANFPAVRSPFGKPIRRMFGATPSRVFIGADLEGLEARMLAHYMDDPDFTDEILNGDIHTANQHKAGLPTRDAAKTFFYGLLYGAGDAKVGQLVNGTAEDGKRIKERYFSELPSLRNLIEQKQREARKGYIISLDGRKIKIPRDEDGSFAARKALNSLLQSSGAIFAKTWSYFTWKYIKENNLDAVIVINYHDEMQIESSKEDVEGVKEALQWGVDMANRIYDVKCPNAIQIKVGKNWEDTH